MNTENTVKLLLSPNESDKYISYDLAQSEDDILELSWVLTCLHKISAEFHMGENFIRLFDHTEFPNIELIRKYSVFFNNDVIDEYYFSKYTDQEVNDILKELKIGKYYGREERIILEASK